jgi:hypothetical protein
MMFPPNQVTASPIVALHLGPDGMPAGATAAVRIPQSPEKIWPVIADVQRGTAHIPMISKVKRDGARVNVQLRFRISLFSVGFQFEADATQHEGEWLEIRWVSGEPRELRIRFDLTPVADGCVVQAFCGFDLSSLGWLVKYFLKHHPEIQWGVFPGSALVLLESLKKGL